MPSQTTVWRHAVTAFGRLGTLLLVVLMIEGVVLAATLVGLVAALQRWEHEAPGRSPGGSPAPISQRCGDRYHEGTEFTETRAPVTDPTRWSLAPTRHQE